MNSAKQRNNTPRVNNTALQARPRTKRLFQLEDAHGNCLARGNLYNEGNCQITWRADIGYTQEQYHSPLPVLSLMSNVTVFRFVA